MEEEERKEKEEGQIGGGLRDRLHHSPDLSRQAARRRRWTGEMGNCHRRTVHLQSLFPPIKRGVGWKPIGQPTLARPRVWRCSLAAGAHSLPPPSLGAGGPYASRLVGVFAGGMVAVLVVFAPPSPSSSVPEIPIWAW